MWPFRRRRKVPRTPLLSELEAQERAEKALKISRAALQRTAARGPEVTELANRQYELRDANHFGEMFEESMRRRRENG